MATTVTSTKTLPKAGFGGGPRGRGPNGNGHSGNGRRLPHEFSPSRYRIGMWVALASILMLFTALTSAYIVRAASAADWQPIRMPRVLLFSTALILISSGTLENARRKLRAKAGSHRTWLLVTVVLGLGFLASQFIAWRQLVSQGIYVSSHPHSSFFYLLTATHGVHLLGGLFALAYLAVRVRKPKDDVSAQKSQAAADVVTLYWHFMDVLWIYLFVLLFFWK